jgi:hypothetical protein
MQTSRTLSLLLALFLFILSGCAEYSTKSVETNTDSEIKATYETYHKTITKEIPSVPNTILAIQLQQMEFKKGLFTITVRDPDGKKVLEKALKPGTYQDAYTVTCDKEGKYELTFTFEHMENGKHLITWETD